MRAFLQVIIAVIVLSFFTEESRGSDIFTPEISSTKKVTDCQNLLLPYQLAIGWDNLLNFDDYLMGLSVGVLEQKTNAAFRIGYNTRLWNRKVLGPGNMGLINQVYYEKRSVVYSSLEKKFAFSKNISSFGLLLGVKGYYCYGDYYKYETSQNIEPFWGYTPQAGFFWMNYDISLRVNYEYIDFNLPEPSVPTNMNSLSKHRINVSLCVFIHLIEVPEF